MLGKLESLRGIAACLVVLFHSPFNYSEHPLSLFHNSYLFVDFFFVLSGFVMSHAYSERIANRLSLGEYLALRLGRIYPLHFIMLIVVIPYVLFKQYMYTIGLSSGDQFERNNGYTFISNIFLLQAMGLHTFLSWNVPSWSISTEFYVYIVFYILSITFDKGVKLRLPLFLVIFSYLFLVCLERPHLDITFDFGFVRCLGAFYLGVLVYRIRSLINEPIFSSAGIRLLEIFIVSSITIFVTFSRDYPACLALTMISFAFAVLVFSEKYNGFFGNILESNIFRKVGVWSYSIYLTHWLIFKMMADIFTYVLEVNPKGPMGFHAIFINIIGLIITIFVSRYSYIYIEKKYRDLVKLKISQYKKSSKSASE